MHNKKALSQIVSIVLLLLMTAALFQFLFNWSLGFYGGEKNTFEVGSPDFEIVSHNLSHIKVYNNHNQEVAYNRILIDNIECNRSGLIPPNSQAIINLTFCAPPSNPDVYEVSLISNKGIFKGFSHLEFVCTENETTGFYDGSGSGIDPYQICNCSQLQNVQNDLSADYVLISNVDCNVVPLNTGSGFDPIGETGVQFTGTFNGRNNVISGLYINRSSTNDVGLFSTSLVGSNLSNFGMVNVNITGGTDVGALIGNSNSRVDGVYSTGRVNGSIGVGGLIGVQNEPISNSYSNARVTAESASSGGLIGQATSNVTSSYSTGSVSGVGNAGGLIGYFNGAYYVTNSYSTADVNGTGVRVGGLIGRILGAATINNSYSTGAVYSTSINVGGLIGEMSAGIINNSYSTSSVNSTTSVVGGLVGNIAGSVTISNSYTTGTISADGTVGGLVGRLGGTSTWVTNSYSTGDIYSTASVTGGFVGDMDAGDIESSYSTGDVDSTGPDTGGFVGNANENGITINNSYSTGQVISGGNDAGGFIGELGRGRVNSSYSSGNVTGTGNVGGLIGAIYYGQVNSSFSTGNVSGSGGSVGGILGYLYSTAPIDNSYWNNHSDNPSDSIGVDMGGPSDITAISDDLSYFYVSSNSPMGNWTSSIWSFSGSTLPTLG